MFSLVMSGILWGTGGLTGSLFGRATGLSPLAIAAYRLIAGGLLILVYLAVSRTRLPRPDSPSRSAAFLLALVAAPLGFQPAVASLGLLAVLGTLPTAVAYTLYFRGLRSAAPTTASLMALLEPLTGALLAALILGDRLGPSGLAGAASLTTAVSLAAVTPNRVQ